MDFRWTGEQQEVDESVRHFARTELACATSERASVEPFSANWRKAAHAGLAGLAVSRDYGGRGLDCLTTARVLEALGHGRPDGGFGFALAAHLLACCLPIDRHGTHEQRTRCLPSLCSESHEIERVFRRRAGRTTPSFERAAGDADAPAPRENRRHVDAVVWNPPIASSLVTRSWDASRLAAACGVPHHDRIRPDIDPHDAA